MDDLVEHVVALAGRDLRLLAPRDSDALLDEEAFEHEEFLPYWAELWPSAIALARVLARRPLTGRRVLELGCGLGLPAIAAALAGGAGARDGLVARRRRHGGRNAARNDVALDTAVVRAGATAPARLGPPWPLVLASDVLYEPRNVDALLALLPAVTAASGEVWLADPGRRPAARFLAAAERAWRIDAMPHDGPRHVTVHRLAAQVRPLPSRLCLEPPQRLVRLALGHARDEHPAGDAAEEAAGVRVLVAVVEAGAAAAVQRRQVVDGAGRASPPGRGPPTPRAAAPRTPPAAT